MQYMLLLYAEERTGLAIPPDLMAKAMQNAKSADPKVYLPELAKIQYNGVTGPISFDEKGDIKLGSITIYTVKGGKWETTSFVGGEMKQEGAAPAGEEKKPEEKKPDDGAKSDEATTEAKSEVKPEEN